jgi:hypothetical protein
MVSAGSGEREAVLGTLPEHDNLVIGDGRDFERDPASLNLKREGRLGNEAPHVRDLESLR